MNEKKKGIFMKCIIIYCLAIMAVTNIWAMFIMQESGNNAAPIINAINLVHGGELLLCCVKRILTDTSATTKVRKKSKCKEEPTMDHDFIMTKEFEENHSDLRGE